MDTDDSASVIREASGNTQKFTLHTNQDGKELSVLHTVMYRGNGIDVSTVFVIDGKRYNHFQHTTSTKGMDDLLHADKEAWAALKSEIQDIKTSAIAYITYKTGNPPQKIFLDKVLARMMEKYESDFAFERLHNSAKPANKLTELRDRLNMLRKIVPELSEMKVKNIPFKAIRRDSVEKRLLTLEESFEQLADAIEYFIEQVEDEPEKQKKLSKIADTVYLDMIAALQGMNIAWYITANEVRPWQGWKQNFSYDEEGNMLRVAQVRKSFENLQAELHKHAKHKDLWKLEYMFFGNEDSINFQMNDLLKDLRNKNAFTQQVAIGISATQKGMG